MIEAPLATLWHSLTAPLADPLTRRAALEICLLGVAGGAIGCWIVLYRLAYSTESLAHSLLPGLVLAALTGIPLVVGALASVVVAALAIAVVSRAPGLSRDTGVGIVVTAMFGAGVLLALSPASPPAIGALLFGNILAASDSDLLFAALSAVAVPLLLLLFHGPLLATGFDREAARSLGVRPGLIDAVLLVLVAAVVLVAVQGLGNLLVVVLLVGPAAIARQLSSRLPAMFAAAVATAALTGLAGLYLSYYAGTAAGASIAASTVLAYLAVAALAPRRPAAAGT